MNAPDRVHAEGEGQQHRYRQRRADAGQDADGGPQRDADDAEQQVERGEGGAETDRQVPAELPPTPPCQR